MPGKLIYCALLANFLCIHSVWPQKISWSHSETSSSELELFHSIHVISLPTAETLQKGDVEFEISHRFTPPVKKGYDAFWGLDGPANIRFGLSYAPSNRMIICLGRSNVTNNLDLQVRYKAFQLQNDVFPLLATINLNAAWNSSVDDRPNGDARNFQYAAQVILNTLLFKKLGFGFVPSYLYNSDIFTEDIKYSITMGSYVQYYIARFWSVMLEWNPTFYGWRNRYNALSMGLEIETGGHFFKVFVTNNININLSQYLTGADKKFGANSLRLGFMITRLF